MSDNDEKGLEIRREFSAAIIDEVEEMIGVLDRQVVPFDQRHNKLADRMEQVLGATIQMWLPLFVADYKNQIMEQTGKSRVMARERVKANIPMISNIIANAVMSNFLDWFDREEREIR